MNKKNFDQVFFEPLANVLENLFPKENSKQNNRSAAIVLNAQANIYAMDLLKAEVGDLLTDLETLKGQVYGAVYGTKNRSQLILKVENLINRVKIK